MEMQDLVKIKSGTAKYQTTKIKTAIREEVLLTW